MKAIQLNQWKVWLFPFLLLICPCFFLSLWIIPFCFWLPTDISYFLLSSKPGTLFCYAILLCGVALNWINAVHLSKTQNFKGMQISLLIIRIASIIVYPALLWGQLQAILYLMGPAENQHIFFLITLSLVALNISGMFYVIRLIFHLKKIHKAGLLAVNCYIIFGFIIVFDIISVLILQNKCRRLQQNISSAL